MELTAPEATFATEYADPVDVHGPDHPALMSRLVQRNCGRNRAATPRCGSCGTRQAPRSPASASVPRRCWVAVIETLVCDPRVVLEWLPDNAHPADLAMHSLARPSSPISERQQVSRSSLEAA